MKIDHGALVSLDVTMYDAQGNQLEHSGEPLVYLHGHDDVFPLVEEALAGKEAGARVALQLEPEEAFGDYDPELVLLMSIEDRGEGVEVGMRVEGDDGEGASGRIFSITDIAEGMQWARTIATPFILLQGVPPVLKGVLLLFFIAFKLKLAPLGGAYSTGVIPDWSSPAFVWDVVWHQILPGLELLLGSVGGWTLSMRGMGVTIQGEDYVNFDEHKGLGGYAIFKDYYLRNALLPQVTRLALALGSVVSSAIVIESQFGLPGLGRVLDAAIRSNDFLVIYGVVLFVTIAVATLMVLMEFLYPLLDPRIRNE